MYRRSLRLVALVLSLLTFLLVAPTGVTVLGRGEARAETEPGADDEASIEPTLAPASAEGAARKNWKVRLDNILKGRRIGVSVRLGDRYLYNWNAKTRRVPASNEKLLMSMALFNAMDPTSQLETKVAAVDAGAEKIVGDLWLIGRGDPSLTGGGSFGKGLPFTPTRIARLAKKVKQLGIRRITGSVMGAVSYFSHDWFAPGWKSDFPAEQVPLATALSFEGNTAGGKHISDPEARAAKSLTKKLRAIGVRVAGGSGTGAPPPNIDTVAAVRSVPLVRLARYTNFNSSNYFAEMLGKQLGVIARGAPGTIAKGGSGIEAWAEDLGVTVVAHDSSGLSYSNLVAPKGFVRLLEFAATQPWGSKLRSTLPSGNQGTLEGRLHGVQVRAKTGTLSERSALSGYVFLDRVGTWASFSIISQGMAKSTAVDIENRVVKLLEDRAN
ncbi:MAG: hypothetical protein GEU71_12845 [Actinobacteria bacterium]|nr:hypothetical protein [Actinomycetota bacterium]